MKKILFSSVILFLFSLSIIVFQMSCKKEAQAQINNYTLPPATANSLGGVIIGNGLTVASNGTLSVSAANGGLQKLNKIIFAKLVTGGGATEIWTMNYDGTNKTKVNISMPAGEEILFENPRLSPDGNKVIFMGTTISSSNNDDDIYICNIDGTGVTKIYDMPVGTGHTTLGGAY